MLCVLQQFKCSGDWVDNMKNRILSLLALLESQIRTYSEMKVASRDEKKKLYWTGRQEEAKRLVVKLQELLQDSTAS